MRVVATGELDLSTVAQLDAALREQLAAGEVLLDLRELDFMDSTGVRMLDAVLRDADREGWRLGICSAMAPQVRQVLEITGVLAQLPLVEDGA